MIKYEGNVFRPPSEANSLLVQATIGCSYNRCAFCALYKGEKFRVRELDEILSDFKWARSRYRYVEKIFLCDGDALCLSMEKLLAILKNCRELFPECRSINVYGNARDVLAKGPDNLKLLKENGVGIIYIGAESGSDKVLEYVNKGSDSKDMEMAIRMTEDSGIKASVTLISGLGGRKMMEEHAVKSAELISKTAPSYFSFLTLVLTPEMDLYKKCCDGEFITLSTNEVFKETIIFFENLNLPEKIESVCQSGIYRDVNCIFRSNHASNALMLRGELPRDRQQIISVLKRYAAF